MKENTAGRVAGKVAVFHEDIGEEVVSVIGFKVDTASRRCSGSIDESAVADCQIFSTDHADSLPVVIVANDIVDQDIFASGKFSGRTHIDAVTAGTFQGNIPDDHIFTAAYRYTHSPL